MCLFVYVVANKYDLLRQRKKTELAFFSPSLRSPVGDHAALVVAVSRVLLRPK